MTIKIEFFVPHDVVLNDEGSLYLKQAMRAIGYAPASPSMRQIAEAAHDEGFEVDVKLAKVPAEDSPSPLDPEPTTTPFREFGKAPEGKTRRTKEEIAEDETLEKLIGKYKLDREEVERWVREMGHEAAITRIEEVCAGSENTANISASPEDRQDPENPADAEQDAADEKAEVDAARDPEAPLTLDDLKSAMNGFVEAKGMPTTQKEGPGIFEKALGKPPAGEAAWKLSLLSEATQEQLSAAIAAWKEAAK